VCWASYQELLLLPRTSSGEWASRSHQQDHFQNFEKEVRWQERRLSRWSPGSPLGLLNYEKNSYRRNPLCSGIRNWSSHPGRVGVGKPKVESYKAEANTEGLKLHLDLLQEKRDHAQITLSAYQERMAKYFNRKVKPRNFKVGDLVLRKVTLATRDPVEGKLASS
jgi:hypothetical protein